MKKLKILIIFLAFHCAYGQTYKAVYSIEVKQKEKSNNGNNEDYYAKQAKILGKKMIAEVNATTFSLLFNSEKALFQPIERMGVEEIKQKLAKVVLIRLQSHNKVYSDVSCNEVYIYHEAGGNHHLRGYPLEHINWKLTNEQKKFQGYTLIKATAEMQNNNDENINVEAWFCPDISTKFGPALFNGLPGLIMQVKAIGGKYDYSFELKSLKKERKNTEITIPLDKYDVLTEEESNAVYRKMMSNLKPN
ncbi:GLPGLI family protein [Mesonia hippocampi]|uniref:GLPGLI family protein n=1 Tax=Mesonia hippocampi TaxID=1628250 RepID=A0A840EPE6_9FLAO|nr:GLPGLI family protein [Mesonia hippocampi]MBB4118473.1 GLPGLI family protein [Mesonia hippocampi]